MKIQHYASHRSFRSMFFVLAALVALVLSGNSLMAQGTTGTLTGTVSDQNGAVMPGASVTIHQVETNAERVLTTSDAGTYKATMLQPGHYTIKVEKAGFKALTQGGITLSIDQTLLVDLKLEIGAATESVEVTTAPPVIQTEDSSVGQLIDSQSIQNTPLNGRLSVMGLIALAPGMQGVGAQDQMATRGLTVAAGTGSRNSYGGLGIIFDGVINKEITLQRGEPEIPSLDALSQFKVLSTGAPAEFSEPTQIIVVSASGGNQYHGGLFEYNRSKGTSAKSYFNGSKPRPAYERNEFGGNFAGPIFIPHIYNGRDRSFFFVAYEGFRLTQSTATQTQQPSALMRQGNFSQFLDSSGNCPANTSYICVKNPATGVAYTGNIITDSLNTVSLKLMNLLMPVATTSGTGTNTYENVPYSSDVKRFSLRFDHKINDNNNIRFTWLRAFYGPNSTVGNDSLQGGNSGDGEHNSQFILGYTHTFTPSLVMDLNTSFLHLPIYRTPQNVGTNWESVIPGLSSQLIEGAPTISITNIQSISESGSKDLEQAVQLNASLTKVMAHHTIKIGGSYVYDNHWNVSAASPQRGSYTFTNNYTGLAFADFLLGLPTSTSQTSPASTTVRHISSQWAGYIQDDWKPFPKLTINAGIRYDLQWFAPGPYNRNSLFVPSLGKVVYFGNSLPSSAVSSYVTLLQNNNLWALASDVNLPTNVYSYLGRPNKNFAPRLGFAYQLQPNTVLRGAFGLYFNLLPSSYAGGMMNTLPFNATNTYTNTSTYSATSTFTMSAPFASTGSAGSQPSVNAEHPLVTPYTESYNLALEHQFPHGLSARVGYVGQHNLKQNNYGGSGNYARDLNALDVTNSSYNAVNSAASQRPISVLGSIPYNMEPIFHSTMNSLQVGIHKQYNKSLSVGMEYQWTRVLGIENLQDPTGKYPRDSYGPVSGITPQVLQMNYTYALPLGQGQIFFPHVNNVVNKALKGWEISGVINAQSGQPFSATYTSSSTYNSVKYSGLVSGRANRVAGVALYPTKKTRTLWFNPSAFTAPTATVASTSTVVPGAAYGNSGYNMLRGPLYQDWDMNLKKNTEWRGHYNLQIRADVFNVFNHPNFATPNSAISNTSTVGTVTAISSTPAYQARTMEFAAKFTF